MSIAYLANSFPEAVEPYVWEEIEELRRRGAIVLPLAMRIPICTPEACAGWAKETQYAFPLRCGLAIKASWALVTSFWKLRHLIARAVGGPEKLKRRFRTLAHTWLGAYLAVLLARKNVSHIHVHHGYFAAWAGMIAAKILDAGFSMTLHGSDLLVRADYLDVKLAECSFCFTISEFNRRHILKRYSEVDPAKVLVQRLGIDTVFWWNSNADAVNRVFSILSVGRLHAIKNQGFLILACNALKNRGVPFCCSIAGEGEERSQLQALIDELGLQRYVSLLGAVSREQLPALYAAADIVVLTSHSEGVPVTLMEAMSMERIVVAPRLSGIPELVNDGENGLLFTPESMEDFLAKLYFVIRYGWLMRSVRQAARLQICSRFNRQINVPNFASHFLALVSMHEATVFEKATPHENPLLQQI